MKKTLFLWALLLVGGAAQAQVSDAEKQALAKHITQLMRNPEKPNQDLQFTLKGCHLEQIIRDNKADVQMSQPVSVSYSKGDSNWGMKLKDGHFEMKMGFEWVDIKSITYELNTDDDDQKHYQVNIKRQKGDNSTTFNLPLYTTNESVVKGVVQRLEKVRQSCQ
jgi:hypothetical protein